MVGYYRHPNHPRNRPGSSISSCTIRFSPSWTNKRKKQKVWWRTKNLDQEILRCELDIQKSYHATWEMLLGSRSANSAASKSSAPKRWGALDWAAPRQAPMQRFFRTQLTYTKQIEYIACLWFGDATYGDFVICDTVPVHYFPDIGSLRLERGFNTPFVGCICLYHTCCYIMLYLSKYNEKQTMRKSIHSWKHV